jgi:predicted anti-sigma-YlaC factor YlaD
MTCADVQLLAAEAALGLVSGADRAALLEHLDICEECRTLVHDLAGVADALVVASPPAEPSAGFEQRVLERLGAAPRRRRWPALVGAAAAALLLVLAFAIGRNVGTASKDVREVAMRTPSGRMVGEAYLHDGSPPWVFAAVPGWKDDLTEYRLRITLADGTSTEATGIGSWGTMVADAGQVRSVELVGADGRVWCSAAI